MALSISPLVNRKTIDTTIKRLAQELDQDYQGRSPVVIGVLSGSMIFLADLVRVIATPLKRIAWVKLASYGDRTTSGGDVRWQGKLPPDLGGEDILVVEDIVESGRSWQTLKKALHKQQPRSVKICTLLDKPSRRVIPVRLDYVGLTIGDEFVVGYGMDYAEQFRQLPELYRWQ